MKRRNLYFTVSLVCINIFLVYAFIQMFRVGYSTVLAFMFIVFCPMIVQLVCSILFLFIVIPLRNLTARPLESSPKGEGRIDSRRFDSASVEDYPSQDSSISSRSPVSSGRLEIPIRPVSRFEEEKKTEVAGEVGSEAINPILQGSANRGTSGGGGVSTNTVTFKDDLEA
ncbi:hypothetical protein EON65_04685 [archaeon]|nr:MAG: hypothetical protein EON65_04685 [archaeon]